MECKKRSKGSVWEFCYANKIFGTFGVEMRASGQKLVKFCTLTHAAKLVVRIVTASNQNEFWGVGTLSDLLSLWHIHLNTRLRIVDWQHWVLVNAQVTLVLSYFDRPMFLKIQYIMKCNLQFSHRQLLIIPPQMWCIQWRSVRSKKL